MQQLVIFDWYGRHQKQTDKATKERKIVEHKNENRNQRQPITLRYQLLECAKNLFIKKS
jgi:hypothetical protein